MPHSLKAISITSPDLSLISRCVFHFVSLYVAKVSSKYYTASLRFQDLNDSLAYSYLIVLGEHV